MSSSTSIISPVRSSVRTWSRPTSLSMAWRIGRPSGPVLSTMSKSPIPIWTRYEAIGSVIS
jgi:hypothetical protein